MNEVIVQSAILTSGIAGAVLNARQVVYGFHAVFTAIPYCIDLIEGAWLEEDPAQCRVFRPSASK